MVDGAPGTASFPGRPKRKRVTKRRVQTRAIETRLTILEAALSEFAGKGFEAASLRVIAERTGLQHPLITYHYRTKEILWKAVAEHVFDQIRERWDSQVPEGSALSSIEIVRREYRAFMDFTLEYPDMHHFMLRETQPGSTRLPWLAEKLLKPLLGRVLHHIEAAQKEGDLPPGDPVLLHYMLIGVTTVLSSLGADVKATSGRSPSDPAVVAEYWRLIETVVLNRRL